jgi:hypothetical protein
MKKVKHGLVYLAAASIFIVGFYYVGQTIYIKYTGEKVTAVVVKTPSSCDRYNQIYVLLEGEEYEINISRQSCRDRKYRVGQQVQVLRNKKYKELVWPHSRPELVPLLVLAVLILAYFSWKGRFKKRMPTVTK